MQYASNNSNHLKNHNNKDLKSATDCDYHAFNKLGILPKPMPLEMGSLFHIVLPMLCWNIQAMLAGGEISRDLVADVSIAAVFDSKASNKARDPAAHRLRTVCIFCSWLRRDWWNLQGAQSAPALSFTCCTITLLWHVVATTLVWKSANWLFQVVEIIEDESISQPSKDKWFA